MKGLTELKKYVGLIPDNKSAPLAKLSSKHKQILLLHLQGLDVKGIAEETGSNPGHIYRVIRDPKSQEAIAQHFEFTRMELEALQVPSLAVLRTALASDDVEIGLKAVDKVFKATGQYQAKDSGEATAEDVVKRIIEATEGDRKVKITEERKIASHNKK